MASQTSHAIMQAMRGSRYDEQEPREPEADPTVLEIERRLRGKPTDTTELRKASAEAEREYLAALAKRTQELRDKHVPHAEHVARAQLQSEAQQRSEAEQKRRVHEQMRQQADASEREYWETRANQPLRADRAPEPGAPYVTPGNSESRRRDRTSERLMAQANGTVWDLYQQEQANA